MSANMIEPVSLERAKEHLRIADDDSEDALIAGYIAAAREWVENHTGHLLVRRQVVETRAGFGAHLQLYKWPVVSVDAVSYVDPAGATQAYQGAVSRIERRPARIFPAADGSWPSTGRNGAVTVTYTAGYEASEEPQSLIVAMLMLIASWYHVREAVNVGNITSDMPLGVEALCRPYRRFSL
jgi:uncharacterized phiE125 gp8 family phage protein